MFLLLFPSVSQAKITIASAAGYRGMVNALVEAYTKETGNQSDLIYGNMAQVVFQAQASDTVDMVIGDRAYLTKAKLPFDIIVKVGRGRLVAIYPKGRKVTDATLFTAAERIAIPDTGRAIYGKAAKEYLQTTGLYDTLQSRLFIVSSVPQAASYVISGEVDLALVNLTHALNIKGSIGGCEVLNENNYSPIEIIAGQQKTTKNREECIQFLNFIHTEKAQQIVTRFGL
ncbi:molybdate ABC transporter substrate-binding protein [Desulforhopalus vacuolatus]|uniref:molybdate ABC transporter substrate-binding protein n=1 Tax=Desulforhopalus vacuolatus TaxID=40414 RepID=UPI001F069CF3|nr:molybdate ABC transporter substrate-binding protein [Desulforhopalus vacuolatus]